jgi:hypothetical protein
MEIKFQCSMVQACTSSNKNNSTTKWDIDLIQTLLCSSDCLLRNDSNFFAPSAPPFSNPNKNNSITKWDIDLIQTLLCSSDCLLRNDSAPSAPLSQIQAHNIIAMYEWSSEATTMFAPGAISCSYLCEVWCWHYCVGREMTYSKGQLTHIWTHATYSRTNKHFLRQPLDTWPREPVNSKSAHERIILYYNQ